MIELSSARFILSVLIIGSVLAISGLVVLFFTFALRSSPRRKRTLANTIQEGVNETNVDFEVKHPRAMFECPYDLKSCAHIDTSTMTINMKCDDCPRYGHGIRPSKL